jgi:hypothetical protein
MIAKRQPIMFRRPEVAVTVRPTGPGRNMAATYRPEEMCPKGRPESPPRWEAKTIDGWGRWARDYAARLTSLAEHYRPVDPSYADDLVRERQRVLRALSMAERGQPYPA